MKSQGSKKLIVGITAPPSVELLHGQLKFLKEHGYDVFLLAPDHERVRVFCEKEGVGHIDIKIERNISFWKDLFTLFSLIHIFFREKPDIINLGTPKISLLGMMAAFLNRVPLRLYTCRGFRFEHETGFFNKVLITMEKITAACSHKVFCISKSVRDLGVHEGIFKKEKTELIGKGSSNGLDLKLFNPESLKLNFCENILDEFDLRSKFIFGYVGRIVDRKGIKELYQAFDLIYSKNKNTRLLVVGRPFWDQVSDPGLIESMEKHPGIIMAGFQKFERVPYFLKSMDCFVLPAWWEGFGNVLIQAAAMGVPIISTNASGCKDAVNDGFNGILVEKKNVAELEKGMDWMLSNESERLRMGKNGISWSRHFKPEVIWEGLHQIYQQ
ncbi:MAG: glycosyltransferase family 4 protein [Cyclobacteriaceae bacterium]|nr:glycosyltransferase family 4 protein [Cyclobacteriaceae bacterium]